ncbi:TonB-linked SusC/RagA family outer membrane protein [Mucilaginibacter frigoritolerans]|uniref:TonB-linked SusC/RagA family outer membrane protein n=1 Tax=Mucilaginibacter frigoritolerans TaxID=652788 RepID=A0A562TNX6_9SPHI|nr:TonB-dependent receptor [Mucilaginibacter frigoritolerans]TWI95261.1 TonB-linked SusC/RagA family outer membrane protein [Mucilaginibacter frigoritolerans]
MKRFTHSILKDGDMRQAFSGICPKRQLMSGKHKLVLFLLILLPLLTLNAYAQTITVSGQVSDANGVLPGVTVSIPGTGNGVVTDVKGAYSIKAGPTADLSFSLIGYKTLLIHINNQTNINVTLQEENKELNEVVVVGYGAQKKVNLTGSVSTISGVDMIKRPVVNTTTMLEGLAPGVAITQGSGEPGNENASIKIRGVGTFSGAGSDPLVLIDDVPGNLNDVNPTDIESVSVLKDASSTAIYGSRAANGVILVTTKKGKAGKLKVEYDGNVGIYTYTKMFSLVTNSVQYMNMYNTARINSGLTDPTQLYTPAEINAYATHPNDPLYPNTNWLPYLFRTAPTQTHNLTFSGGNDKTTYNINFGYVDENGIMRGFDYQKYNIRSNLQSKVNDHITFGTNILLKSGVTDATSNGSEDMFLSTLSQAPTYGPYTADGSGNFTYKAYPFEYNNKNPVAVLDDGLYHDTKDYVANIQGWANVTFNKDFSWYTKAAFNGEFDNYKNFVQNIPEYYYQTGQLGTTLDLGQGLTVQDEHTIYSNLFSYLKYNHSFGSHTVSAQAGWSIEQSDYEYLQAYRQNFVDPALQEINAGSTDHITNAGTSNAWALESWFGRVDYNYKERYLLESNIRFDGSSKFAPGNKWGTFPSASAGWRVTEEPFVKDLNLNWLSNLKFRGSWGQVGNQNIVEGGYGVLYPYQALLNFTGAYSFNNQNLTTGVAQTQLNNLQLQWETTTMTDIGADITLVKHFNVTFDWYNRVTSNILRQSQITAVVGLQAPTINDGTVDNKGVELGLTYGNSVNGGTFSGLTYNFGLNLDHNTNKLVKYGAPDIYSNSINEQGYPINSFYMLQVVGIFQNAQEVANSPKQYGDATQPGDLKYKDVNGDGKIDDNDRVIIPGVVPKLNYSFSASGSWKGFDLSVLMQGVYGVKYFVNDWGTIPFVQGAPPTTNWLNAWSPTNPSTTMPRLYWGFNAPQSLTRPSTFFLQDGSYLRVKNLVFGYTIPVSVTKHIGIDRLRVYFSGDNLFTFTKYPGLDPERAASGDFLTYPQNKIYSFGVNVTF